MLRKLLKSAGITLILLPEPFTTPLGIVLLGAAYIFGRGSRVDSSRALRGLITCYLNDARPFGPTGKIIQHKLKTSLPDCEWYTAPKEDVKNIIDNHRLLLRFGESVGSMVPAAVKPVYHSLSERWAGFVWADSPSSGRMEKKTVNHTIDSNRLSLRYDEPAKSFPSGRIVEKAIYHSLKRGLSGYVLPSKPLVCEKTVRHSVNGNCLAQHYKKTMTFPASPSEEKPLSHVIDEVRLRLVFASGN